MSDYPITRQLLLMLLLVAIPVSSAWATHRSEAEQAIADAKATHEKAVAAGVATDASAEMIKEAEALLDNREYTQAVKVSTWASRQDSFALEVASGEATVDADLETAAKQAIEAAIAAADKANSVGGEWRDTRKMISEAEKLVSAGEFEKAIKEAIEARKQGELGYEQAMREKGADMPDYMRAAVK